MRRYETIVISDPDLSDEDRAPLFDRMKELISQEGGVLLEFDEWGTRKLAYEIRKKPRGHYLRLDYCGEGRLVDELERFYRIDDRIMKYMTILLEKNPDVESLKKSLEKPETEEDSQQEKTAVEAPETDAADDSAAEEESEAEAEGEKGGEESVEETESVSEEAAGASEKPETSEDE